MSNDQNIQTARTMQQSLINPAWQVTKWIFLHIIPKVRFLGILKLSTAIVSTAGAHLLSPGELQIFIKFIAPFLVLLLMWPSHTLPRFEGHAFRILMGILSLDYIFLDHNQGWPTTLIYGAHMPIESNTFFFGGFSISVAAYSIARGIGLRKKEGAYRGFGDFALRGIANLTTPTSIRTPIYPAGYLERRLAQQEFLTKGKSNSNEFREEILRSKNFLSSSAWIRLREEIFIERQGECTDCGSIHRTVKNGKTVECYPRHIIYPGNYPELGLLKENVIILCKDCGKSRSKHVISEEYEYKIAQSMRQQILQK